MIVPALCQSCGGSGTYEPDRFSAKPSWCTCLDFGGPYIAPPGHVTCYRVESKEDAAFRERCRLAGNAERQARDAAICAKWVRAGKGYRELPLSSPKRRTAEFVYRKALRALRRLQRECSHPSRSMFNEQCCDVCFAHVQCDVAQYRHLVKQVGKREARRFVA